MSSRDQFKAVQLILQSAGLYKGTIDGIPGRGTRYAFDSLFDKALAEYRNPPVELVKVSGITIPQEAIELILGSEGIDQPWKWPGGDSGITLGRGDDIGADPKGFEDRWRKVIPDEWISRLATAKGLTGEDARVIAYKFKDMTITKAQADQVFFRHTLPVEIARTRTAFPGSEELPPAAFGALVSLVYNRGGALTGKNRQDMMDIHNILADGVQKGDLEAIAKQLREMKVIWAGKGLDGLITRREREAQLVESAIV